MTLKTRITFTRPGISHIVTGLEVEVVSLTVGDITARIPEVEDYLERLTGLKVKIETEASR